MSTPELRMYYEIRGQGPRLLFISGTGGDLRRSPNAFGFPLARHFEVLAFDQRGLGQTDTPDVAYTMEAYAHDAERLLEALGWTRCFVIGVSFGGMVAQELALRFPVRVERLVLCCTSSGGAGGASFPLHELRDLQAEERARRVVELSDLRRDADWQTAHRAEFEALVADTTAGLRAIAEDPDRAAGARRQIEARRHHDTFDRLPSLQMPVYVCGGRHDGIAPVDNQRALLRQIPAARFELFDGGHLFLLQDPRSSEAIRAFLVG